MRTGSLVDRLLGLPAKSNRNIAVHADLPVPMRDGAVLYADRYAPMGQGHAPVVLMRTPYGRKHLWKRLYCLPFAQRGYQVVIQSCRGTEDSVGQLVPFDERDDGLDTVAWLRAQPWYPGRFVAFGPSYWGLAQWALADGAADGACHIGSRCALPHTTRVTVDQASATLPGITGLHGSHRPIGPVGRGRGGDVAVAGPSG